MITKLFIINGLGICINLKYHVSYMFYGWKFSQYTDVPITSRKIKSYLYADDYIAVFYWGLKKLSEVNFIMILSWKNYTIFIIDYIMVIYMTLLDLIKFIRAHARWCHNFS